jgi:hypothetical protein
MLVIRNDMTVACDVDDTLVMWSSNRSLEERIHIEAGEISAWVWPHRKHIDQLKKHKARNHKIIVWSAGGFAWAEAVVNALELNEYVDVVMAKFQWYYDDLRSEEFMPECNRNYYSDDTNEKTMLQKEDETTEI